MWERFLDEVWTYERLPNRAHGGHPCAATPAQARSRCRSPRVDPDRPRSRLPVRDLMRSCERRESTHAERLSRAGHVLRGYPDRKRRLSARIPARCADI